MARDWRQPGSRLVRDRPQWRPRVAPEGPSTASVFAFAQGHGSVQPMKTLSFDRVRSAAEAAAYRRRSEMYRWLRSRHGELLALLAEFEPPWRVIAAEMAVDGVTGGIGKGTGKPPTDRAIRRTWRRVCRDLAAEDQLRLAGVSSRTTHPSRISTNWRPRDAQQAAALATSVTTSNRAVEQSPARDGNASLARLRRTLLERSGRNPDEAN